MEIFSVLDNNNNNNKRLELKFSYILFGIVDLVRCSDGHSRARDKNLNRPSSYTWGCSWAGSDHLDLFCLALGRVFRPSAELGLTLWPDGQMDRVDSHLCLMGSYSPTCLAPTSKRAQFGPHLSKQSRLFIAWALPGPWTQLET